MRAPHACTLCGFRCDCGEVTIDDCTGCSICAEADDGDFAIDFDEAEDEEALVLAELGANYYARAGR